MPNREFCYDLLHPRNGFIKLSKHEPRCVRTSNEEVNSRSVTVVKELIKLRTTYVATFMPSLKWNQADFCWRIKVNKNSLH